MDAPHQSLPSHTAGLSSIGPWLKASTSLLVAKITAWPGRPSGLVELASLGHSKKKEPFCAIVLCNLEVLMKDDNADELIPIT